MTINAQDLASAVQGALRLEIQAVRARQRQDHRELFDGVHLGVARDRHAYRFTVREDLLVVDGAPIRLRHAGTWHDGEVAAVGTGVVVLNLRDRLSEPVGEALLKVDASYLLELQSQRWAEALEPGWRPQWSLMLGCLRPAGTDPAPALPAPKGRVLDGLNERQRESVRTAGAERRTYLWGPPGTGKTTTVAAMVHHLADQGLSVLLVSNTNAALDTALERLLSRDHRFTSGHVVRVGASLAEALADRNPAVLLHELVAQRGKRLGERRAEVEVELRRVRRALTTRRRALAELDEEDQRDEQLTALHEQSLQDAARARSAAESAAQLRGRLQAQLRRQEADALGGLGRVSAALRRDVRLVGEDLEQRERDVAAADAARAELTQRYQDLLSSRRAATRERHRQECHRQLAAAELSVARLQREREQLDQALDALASELVSAARVVACTAHKAYLHADVRGRAFDVVVVDEASMLPLSVSLFVTGLASRSVVFAGDFRQLPPIVHSDSPQAHHWLKRDVFVAAQIPELVVAGRAVPGLVQLREQHRMRPDIAELVSDVTYREAPLATPEAVRARPRLAGGQLADRAVVLVDTGPLGSRTARAGGLSSWYNVAHAQIAGLLLAHGIAFSDGTVGCIAPYRAQARLLAASLPGDVRTSTVHRFQGGECDTVLLDTTVGSTGGLGSWFRAQEVNDDGARLLNVALSRARERLVILVDLGHLQRGAAAAGPVAELLRKLASAELLDLGYLRGGELLVDDDIPGRLDDDLQAAAGSVDVCSPRLARATVTRLCAAAARVKTVVRTLPAAAVLAESRERHRTRICELEDAGAQVECRMPCAEDVAIIDRKIVWTRAAGLLGPVEKGEHAQRVVNSNLAEQLLALSARKRQPRDPPVMANRETSSCGGCGRPRTRVERWDGRAWDQCHADGCGPGLPRQRMEPVVAWDAVAERRAALRRVGIHDFLVDDK